MAGPQSGQHSPGLLGSTTAAAVPSSCSLAMNAGHQLQLAGLLGTTTVAALPGQDWPWPHQPCPATRPANLLHDNDSKQLSLNICF